MLSTSFQVLKEMNSIFSSDVVGRIRENWEKVVPVLLSLAKKNNSANIRKLLTNSSYASQLDSSFGK